MISPMAVNELPNIMGKESILCSCSVLFLWSATAFYLIPYILQNPLLEYYHFQNRGQLKYTESAQNCCVFLDSHLSAHFVHAMCFLRRLKFHCVRNRFAWYVFYACMSILFASAHLNEQDCKTNKLPYLVDTRKRTFGEELTKLVFQSYTVTFLLVCMVFRSALYNNDFNFVRYHNVVS